MRMPPSRRRVARRITPALALTVAPAIALSGLTAPAQAAEPASAPTVMATPQGVPADASLTLITGDVVRVHALGDGTSTIEVDRPEGATGGVRTQTLNGKTYVLPDEALPFVSAKSVDIDLFNIDLLLDYGYTDGIPVIASYGSAMPRSLSALDGAGTGRALPSINAAAYTVDGDEPGTLWDDLTSSGTARALTSGVDHLWLDGKVKVDLTESVPQIGAPGAWAAGYDGTGTSVAVLDTGIDAEHPDLADRITVTKDFTGSPNGVDDMHGHGTHVASTIAGTGVGDGLHKGVAPGADVIVGKVLDDSGYGQDSWIIDAMEWAVDQDADVVNMSLGGQFPDDGSDPMALAVDELSASGTLFVIAAGNDGCSGCISAPGSASSALTVGAVDKADEIAYFSNQGPLHGTYALKPDISAPGVDISAARSQYAGGSGLYQSMSGTSMATPHMVGAAAILKQRHPDWTGTQLKDALMSTSEQLAYTPYQIGTGRVDVAAAVSAAVTATGSVDFGFYDWPHEDGPAAKTVTYTNSGDTDVTLDVTVAVADQDGAAAPEGAFTVAPSVTVPAGGSSTVDVVATPALLPFGKTYGGKVAASVAGTAVAATGLGLVKEAERYALDIKAIGRDGKPAAGSFLMHGTDYYDPYPVAIDGETTLRMPPSTYAITMFLNQPGPDGAEDGSLYVLLAPEVKLDGDTTVVLDARTAVKSQAITPVDTVDRQRHVWTHRTFGEQSTMDNGLILPLYVEDVYVTPTAPVTEGGFEFYARWRKGLSPLTLSLLGLGEVDALVQAGSTQTDFRWLAKQTVYAGKGSAADYEGLKAKGRIAVVKRSDEVEPDARAAAAKAAGVALLVVVNDRPGVLSEYYETDGLLIAALKADEGAGLVRLAKWGVPLTAVSTKYTPFVYDLVDPHPGSVPTDLTYRPAKSDLARVDARYHGKTPGVGGGFRYDLRPWSPRAIGFAEYLPVPSVRTEWVSAPEGTEYHEIAYSAGFDWESRGGRDVYAPGSRQTGNWFQPVVRPRLGIGAWQPIRYPGTWTTINITPWTDSGPGHAGFLGEESLDLKLYQGETLLEQSEWQAIYLDLPMERQDYRLVLDAQRPDAWEYSTRTHTEWEFSSEGHTAEELRALALLQLDYTVDTDLGGDVKAGSKVSFGLSAAHMPGVTGAGTVTGATFEFSYDDGATWRTGSLAADGHGGWTTTMTAPEDASKYVSIRATARDDAGNSVTQEVIRAFGLR